MKTLLLLLLGAAVLWAAPDANEILKSVDKNQISNTKIITAKMVVSTRRGERTMVSKSWIQGDEKAFTEYLAPAREKGTKMLKLDDQLWTYSPQTDRTIKISGHMLRQSMMGSDMSYEDMMEDDKLYEVYDATVVAEEKVLDYDCWVLELVTTKPDVAYHSRKIWVAKSAPIPLKEERYAKSGKLLKTFHTNKVEKINGRWVATKAVFKDMLKNGDGTSFIIESISFNDPIPEYIFSKAALKK